MPIISNFPSKKSEGIPIATTAGSGTAYTASIPGITELYKGLLITIIPHVVSASTTPTLNVNGLGAKGIRRHTSAVNKGETAGWSSAWLPASKPVLLEYNGTYWAAVGKEKPVATDLDGTVGVNHGGTGKTSFTANRLIYPSATTTLAQLSFPTVDKSVLRQNKSGAPYWSDMDAIAGEVSAAGVQLPIVTTTGTGAAYEATVPGITELKNGVCFIMVPHIVSASVSPTLNVNGLGEKYIYRRTSAETSGYAPGAYTDWLNEDLPILVIYNSVNNTWVVDCMTKPLGADLDGVVSVKNGGTGKNGLTVGYALIGNGTSAINVRKITNNTSLMDNIPLDSSLITSQTLVNALNRVTGVSNHDTEYTLLMVRGESLNAAETTPAVNGAIAWTYE